MHDPKMERKWKLRHLLNLGFFLTICWRHIQVKLQIGISRTWIVLCSHSLLFARRSPHSLNVIFLLNSSLSCTLALMLSALSLSSSRLVLFCITNWNDGAKKKSTEVAYMVIKEEGGEKTERKKEEKCKRWKKRENLGNF